jgi:hypothetical protein
VRPGRCLSWPCRFRISRRAGPAFFVSASPPVVRGAGGGTVSGAARDQVGRARGRFSGEHWRADGVSWRVLGVRKRESANHAQGWFVEDIHGSDNGYWR